MTVLKRGAVWALILAAALIVARPAVAQTRRDAPPEEKEITAAIRLEDLHARLRELERIKAAYPQSSQIARIDTFIYEAKIDLATTIEAVLSLQKSVVGQGQGTNRLTSFVQAATRILDHPKRASFDKAKVFAAVLRYKEAMVESAAQPETFVAMPDKDQQKSFTAFYVRAFDLLIARAEANAGNGAAALSALDSYRAAGGEANSEYLSALGETYESLGRVREAYGAYLGAAVQNYHDAADKAKAIYTHITGRPEDFEVRLQNLRRALPFRPQAFTPPKKWKGKVVLAELFTGAENTASAASDFGFAGLIDTYPAQYLAILEYHVPIPRPDPMMNIATKVRQDYYGITGAPAAVIDGDVRLFGGGTRGQAEARFKQYKAAIDAHLGAGPDLNLSVRAVRSGDVINVEVDIDKPTPVAEYFVALTQSEEIYKGASGIVLHKLIVRDLAKVRPPASKTAVFDLAALEKAADDYLTEAEKSDPQGPRFKFAERHAKIDRQGLQIVVFAQNSATKKVLNAVVGDVSSSVTEKGPNAHAGRL
jgi:tetratricopeptide (TPR) repeat protein